MLCTSLLCVFRCVPGSTAARTHTRIKPSIHRLKPETTRSLESISRRPPSQRDASAHLPLKSRTQLKRQNPGRGGENTHHALRGTRAQLALGVQDILHRGSLVAADLNDAGSTCCA